MREILEIDASDLSGDFAQQAAVFGWIANMMAEAESAYNVKVHQRKTSYAEADDFWRDNLSNSGKKPTENMVSAAIMLDDNYQTACEAELSAERDYRVLRALADALRMRADMLISLGAHMRAEMGMTNAHINDDIDKLVKGVRKQV